MNPCGCGCGELTEWTFRRNHHWRVADPIKRFFSHVRFIRFSDCWEWKLTLHHGYGNFNFKGRMWKAHRWAYTQLVGPIPEGLVLDHLCRNRACVNPAHLEPVTIGENTLRSPISTASINAAKTHCKQGHEFTPENTNLQPSGRYCKECNRVRRRKVA